MKIKVCGMTTMDQLHQLEDIGIDFAGFIFYPKSPRFAGKQGLTGTDVKSAKLKLYKVGVFVDASYDEVMRKVDEFGLDMVQLHGRETPFECSKIADYIDVIKAFRFMENDHVEWMIKDYYSEADMFLFDTGVPVSKDEAGNTMLYGGTGRKFNWNRLKGLSIRKPFFLSGGIEPGDAQLVKDFMQEPVAKDLFVVDINSRFELAPGIKDMEKVKQFKNELNS
ncbi:phosphoribosylanthranilate isomerase [Flavisolibacter ginsengisoli]|jgi:phosphoribosylanthranilate isomerase|uniref:N-(5'-phosphoribosyl)anthranilate isomerase n=1 Tax=Flavisolibacter ginsengisoli DSM 18119 TaxID=1121884 RepID=A0A1M5BF85_9BACT|nr:phosphoribosylanthranilate isomerase [Flavisolibacter ginsengisoli]SHF41223.1 phosphoribosylanthranilate isomerase [Flavisolibacter ginsengisoli DSM 18119]